ncbi:uncharacterized protein FIBRA_05399 [Fibroporia radiculosa]|uniref:WW domain-containing protein n=1 Tax=Fibroporia radiculosa TaxID=599839 RepID=J4IAP5_9APHY|nr:uncharacterized protein FIBRA_05399 [Fibroporia radiculosa]CCM03271.1 predicted protein [Fibroporia radiculosa]
MTPHPPKSPLSLILGLLRLLVSVPVKWSQQHLQLVWLFLKRRFQRLRSKDRDGRGGTTPGGLGSQGMVDEKAWKEEGECDVIYSSREPVSHLGISEHVSPENLLRVNNTPSRPVSVAYSQSSDSPYSIDVQTASQSSINLSVSVPGGRVYRNSAYDGTGQDHLRAPSSRPSSRSSVRTGDRRFAREVYKPTSGRAISRSRSQGRSPVPTPHISPQTSVLSVSFHEKSASNSRINLAVPSGHIPDPLRIQRQRRTQTLYPILQTRRYDKVSVLEDLESVFIVKPLETTFPRSNVPLGWEALVHPEGALYFYHPEKKIFTEAYLCDPDIFLEIDDFAAQVEEVIQAQPNPLPEHVELVLELEENKKENKETKHHWCYYFVDHKSRTLFWLHEYDIVGELGGSLKGLNSAPHVMAEEFGIEENYW